MEFVENFIDDISALQVEYGVDLKFLVDGDLVVLEWSELSDREELKLIEISWVPLLQIMDIIDFCCPLEHEHRHLYLLSWQSAVHNKYGQPCAC